MQIFQTTCNYYCISKTKNEFGQNSEENIIFIGPGQYTKIFSLFVFLSVAGQYFNILTGCTKKDK